LHTLSYLCGLGDAIDGKNVFLLSETRTAMKTLRSILVVLMSALVLHAGIRVAALHHCCAEDIAFPTHTDGFVPSGCACCDSHPSEPGCCHVSCHGLTFVRPSAPAEVQARQLFPAGKGAALPAWWTSYAAVAVWPVRAAVASPPRLLGGRSRLALFSVLVI